jgi:phage FluMu gp28-like protein
MVEGITFTNPVKEKLITNLRQLFQDRKIEIPNNAILIHQLHSLQREQGDVTIRYRHEQGEHDDYVWSLALACYMAGSQPTIRPMVAQTGGVRI